MNEKIEHEKFEKYRKKPVVIEAYRTDKEIIIKTLEGNMKACIGDWIIKGISGELYPCKNEIFRKTYEKYFSINPKEAIKVLKQKRI